MRLGGPLCSGYNWHNRYSFTAGLCRLFRKGITGPVFRSNVRFTGDRRLAVKRIKKSRKTRTPGKAQSAAPPTTRKLRRAAEPSSNGDAESAAEEADESDESLDTTGVERNGAATRAPARRATAQSMAAKQRDISVSEFFAKNRHLLGFDNPRKALLTTVKEAVDNSLDACEEAGILPEIWVHIETTGNDRFKVGVQDNGPGIVKKQIPLIFGKLLYGSKFHRLRQSRGQQGIGISAAGMYGVQTTGKPVKIISKVGAKKPAHYYEIQIDTKKNQPQILNGRGEGVDIPPGEKGAEVIAKHGIEWVDQPHGTRVTIELEAKFVRGRGSVDEYLEQTAIANPHVTLHYMDPDGNDARLSAVGRQAAAGAEGDQAASVRRRAGPAGGDAARIAQACTVAQFLTTTFSRVTPQVARKICNTAKISTRAEHAPHRPAGSRGAVSGDPGHEDFARRRPIASRPIGEELILKGLHQVVPGEFYAAATRPPAVYRGNPFQIEVGIAYGGAGRDAECRPKNCSAS